MGISGGRKNPWFQGKLFLVQSQSFCDKCSYAVSTLLCVNTVFTLPEEQIFLLHCSLIVNRGIKDLVISTECKCQQINSQLISLK